MFVALGQYCLEHFGLYWLLAGLGVVGVLVKWKTAKKPIPIFGSEFLLPRKPIEHDPKIRNAVLKQSFKVNKVNNTTYDVIVIGSGPGGLSSAVLLCRLGYKVLVLEQHDIAGGTCHTFTDKGFEFETGVHYLGDLGAGMMSRYLLDNLTRKQVDFNVLDDAFDQVVVGDDDGEKARWFKILSGEERYAAKLLQYFPEEEDAIRKFLQAMKDCETATVIFVIIKYIPLGIIKFLDKLGVYSKFINMYKYGWHKKTVQEFITEITDNIDLQRIFSYMCGDLGALPSEMNVALFACVNRHFVKGAYYPIGGAQEIPYHMCAEIQEKGGQVLVNANVKSIVCDGEGKAVGVRIEKPDVEIRAKYIISNAGLANTFHKLLPKEIAMKSDMYPMVNNLGPSNSCVTLFVGLDGTYEELGLPSGNVWYFKEGVLPNDGYDLMYHTNYENLPEDFVPPILYIAPGSAKNPDSKITMPGKSTLIMFILCNSQWFAEWHDERKGHRGQVYEDRKFDLAERAWKRCLTIFPNLADKRLYMDVGTSATNKHYLGSTEGEIYGINSKRARFGIVPQSLIRPETGIDGLYITGSDVISVGVVPALYSGLVTVSKIANRNLAQEFETYYNNSNSRSHIMNH